MSIRLRTVVSGALSYVPGALPLYRRAFLRPNPASPENSYGIWLKHLIFSRPHRTGLVPRTVVEIGPGISLGAGLAALLCGAERYIALDVVRFAGAAQVVPTFDRLVTLFAARARPDNANGFPPYESALDAAGFPAQTLPAAHMQAMLETGRVQALRRDVEQFVASGGQRSRHIIYLAPWTVQDIAPHHEVDFVFSHTVLQHVTGIDSIWRDTGAMLGRGGVCSHQISFDCHGTSRHWNGHWSYPEPLWRLALGRKAFLVNREPLSRHMQAANANALTVMKLATLRDASGIARPALASRWRNLSDEDFTTRGALLVARKHHAHDNGSQNII